MSHTVDLTGFVPTDNAVGLSDVLNTNWQTTAAVGLTVATGGVTGAIMLAAFPAQTIVAGASIGTLPMLAREGADGKQPFPFTDKSDKKSDEKSEDQAEACDPSRLTPAFFHTY